MSETKCITCDVCGEVGIERHYHIQHAKNDWELHTPGGPEYPTDLCEPCFDRVHEWIKSNG